MRTVLTILILIIVLVIAGIASGLIDITQIRGARAPQISTTGNGVSAKGGQAPAFDVETGSVKLGTTNATVKVPAVQVHRPGENLGAAATNNAQ
jgi:hypothetical protein